MYQDLIYHQELVNFARKASKFVVGVEGNVSLFGEDCFFIKASGKRMENLGIKDVVKCKTNGEPFEGQPYKPSIETKFHAYLLSQGAKYVCHTHPVNTLKILCSTSSTIRQFAEERLFPDQVVFNGEKSIIIPYAHPGNDLVEEIKKACENSAKLPKVFLLRNHGIITVGNSSEECLIATEICEKAAEIFIGTSCFGGFFSLEKLSIQKILNDKNEIYRQQL